ncbi:AraC-like ligand-binding domain-containing protein [Cupriavidus basilensis]
MHVRLDGRVLPEACELWRAALAPLFDVRIDAAQGAFTGELMALHLGDSLIARCAGSVEHRFKRGIVEIRRSNIDHILIQLYAAGGVQGEYGNRALNAGVGSISVLDLGRTLDSWTPPFANITLTVPRDRLPASLRSWNLHGTVLDAGQGIGAPAGVAPVATPAGWRRADRRGEGGIGHRGADHAGGQWRQASR